MNNKTFEHFPESAKCPICKTNDDKKCCLIHIDGTAEGNICQAQPVHTECLSQFNNFRYSKAFNIIYCNIN